MWPVESLWLRWLVNGSKTTELSGNHGCPSTRPASLGLAWKIHRHVTLHLVTGPFPAAFVLLEASRRALSTVLERLTVARRARPVDHSESLVPCFVSSVSLEPSVIELAWRNASHVISALLPTSAARPPVTSVVMTICGPQADLY